MRLAIKNFELLNDSSPKVQIIHCPTALKTRERKVCVAIGMFDGVHLGHQQVIRQTVADAHQHDAIALVVTFDKHPDAVVAPTHVPPLIYSLPQKLRALESLGCDAILLIQFDREFSRQPAEAFIRNLASQLGHLQSLCVGEDFVFGYKRIGNVALLEKLGAELQFKVRGIPPVSLDGKPVSSTRIRHAISVGNLEVASQMLGRPYSLAGKVIPGDQLGRELGFPTANLDVENLVLPPTGVYAASASVVGQATYRAVVNIGYRPTLQKTSPRLCFEVHLLDFAGELQGQELEVFLGEKLRDERKFPSLTALRDQIARDIATARSRV